MKKIIPNKKEVAGSYELFERIIRDTVIENRQFTAIRFLMCLMDGPKNREFIATFIEETSPLYKRKGQKSLRASTLSNVSRIAKKLHRGGIIRIIYSHPKHDSPCTKDGRIRLGANVTYRLSETSSIFIRGWLYKCFTSMDGPFYESEDQEGELILEDTDESEMGEYSIKTIDKKGNLIETKLMQ